MRILKRYGFAILVVVGILSPLAFFSSGLERRKELSAVERVVYYAGKPVQVVFSFFTETVRNVWDSYIDLRDAREEAGRLREQNLELSVRLQMFRELEAENSRLRQLLNFVKHVDLKFLSGEVKANDPSFMYRSVRLNRGEQDAVLPGMAVVTGQGVVGVVMRVMDKFCDVLLVTDPNSELDVIVARNRRRGIIAGSVGRYMKFKYSERGTRVQVGDEIVTSGLTGAFPPGISVGRVSFIKDDDDGVSQTIEVEPNANLSELSEALILLQPSREVEVIRKVGGNDWMRKIIESSPSRSGG
jgi:rod shape-determining protein MreC